MSTCCTLCACVCVAPALLARSWPRSPGQTPLRAHLLLQEAVLYQDMVALTEDRKPQNPIQDNMENYRKLLSLGERSKQGQNSFWWSGSGSGREWSCDLLRRGRAHMALTPECHPATPVCSEAGPGSWMASLGDTWLGLRQQSPREGSCGP